MRANAWSRGTKQELEYGRSDFEPLLAKERCARAEKVDANLRIALDQCWRNEGDSVSWALLLDKRSRYVLCRVARRPHAVVA